MSHDHSLNPQEYGKLFAIGIALNISYVAIEAFYGWRIESLALLADAGHNLGDFAGLLLAWAAFAAAVVVITTWSLFIKSMHLLFDGSPVEINPKSIIDYFNNHPDIYRFHDLYIWAISTTENSLSVHLVKEDESIDNSRLLNSINKEIHVQYKISHITIQIETKEFARTRNCASAHCTEY